MKLKPWKYIVAVWMTAVIVAGFLVPIPDVPILEESARNLFLHVPMWFTMSVCFAAGLYYSLRYLNKPNLVFDRKAETATQIGLIFGICGLLTGSLWSRFTYVVDIRRAADESFGLGDDDLCSIFCTSDRF